MGGCGGTKCRNSVGRSKARRSAGFQRGCESEDVSFASFLMLSNLVTFSAVNSRQKGGGAGNGAFDTAGGDAIV